MEDNLVLIETILKTQSYGYIAANNRMVMWDVPTEEWVVSEIPLWPRTPEEIYRTPSLAQALSYLKRGH